MSDYTNLISGLRQLSQKHTDIAADAIEELIASRKKELDFYLWDKKRMSRRIATLEGWMDRLFSYDAVHNHLKMTTEIPDTLMREGMDHLEEKLLVEEGDE